MPSPAELLASFSSATAAPVVKAIVWPDSIPEAHPIRKLSIFVRFWPVGPANHLTRIISDGNPGWVDKIFWYVVAASACNESGELIFSPQWPEVWAEAVAVYDAFLKSASPRQDDEAVPPEAVGVYDDTGHLSIPPVDYQILGESLRHQYDDAQGKAFMFPIWTAALDYNGWKLGEGKNSETTGISVPSGEKLAVAAAP